VANNGQWAYLRTLLAHFPFPRYYYLGDLHTRRVPIALTAPAGGFHRIIHQNLGKNFVLEFAITSSLEASYRSPWTVPSEQADPLLLNWRCLARDQRKSGRTCGWRRSVTRPRIAGTESLKTAEAQLIKCTTLKMPSSLLAGVNASIGPGLASADLENLLTIMRIR
jgi:hypothetical protein